MATIKIDKQDDGRYKVRVWAKRDVFGKRKSKQVKDISGITAAKKLGKELGFELDEGLYKNDLTFNQLDDLYYKERQNKVSPATLSTTFTNERNLAREHFGKVKAKLITTKMVQDYADAQLNVRQKTVKNRVAYVFAVLNWAVNEDFLDFYRIKKIHYVEDEEEFEATTLTLDQLAEILAYMKTGYYNLYIPTLISALTTARRSEALGLTWEDIDFENNNIYLRKGMIEAQNKTIVRNKLKTKTSKRVLPMADFLKDELLEHKTKYCLHKDGQVCSNIFNGTIEPDYVTHSFHDMVLAKFNIDMREHDLRHTANQIMYENEDMLYERSKMMGHSNPSTTDRVYTKHTVSDRTRRIVNAFGEELRERMCAKKCANC